MLKNYCLKIIMKTVEIWKKNIKLLCLLGLQMLKIGVCAYGQGSSVQNKLNPSEWNKICQSINDGDLWLKGLRTIFIFPFNLLYSLQIFHLNEKKNVFGLWGRL